MPSRLLDRPTVVTDVFDDAMVAGTVLSLPLVIDRLVPMLAAALDEA